MWPGMSKFNEKIEGENPYVPIRDQTIFSVKAFE
jgi:hypothetical protein